MLIILLVLVIVLVIINVISFFKGNNNENFENKLNDKFNEVEKNFMLNNKNNILEGIGEINKQLIENADKLNNKLNENNEKLSEKLTENSENINKHLLKNNEIINEKLFENNENINKKLIESNDKLSEKLLNSNEEINKKLTEGNEKINNSLFGNKQGLLQGFGEFTEKIDLKLSENNQLLTKNINDFKDEFKKSIHEDFQILNKRIEEKLDKMNAKVEERLMDGFKETTKTFGNVLERLSKIDEAQKKIEDLSTNVVSLQDVLTDKKSRGIFGEVQLYQVLESVFGEKNTKIYEKQHKLSSGTIVDAVLFAPEPMGKISIDSKFPLENYRKMFDRELSQEERDVARKEFVSNMKKHIDDISNKYIIKKETSDQAVLFLPAEAIFAEINAYHEDILDYANKKSVRITSPTTLMAVLTMVQAVAKNIERTKYADIIQRELMKLEEEFGRYEKRWSTLQKDIEKVSKDVKEITTTSTKITNKFKNISNGKFSNSELIVENREKNEIEY